MHRRRAGTLSRRGAAILAAVLAAASVTLSSAYASSSTGPRGGQGAGGVSGYAVSGVHFALGAGSTLSAVHFQLSPATAQSVRVQLTTGGPWIDCSVQAAAASCPVPDGTGAASIDQLSVVAS